MSQFIAHAAQRLSHIAKSKNLVRLVAVLVGIFVFASIPSVARADGALVNNAIYQFLSMIFFGAINMLGKLTVLLFGVLVQVAQYNDFLNAKAVTIGWQILRDLANMLFILVLLVIAFGTAFRIQQYRYNTLLRQLIIMAILINFSKLITGIFIDLMQVIMMTFVNAFASTAAGNLTTALGLDQILKLDTSVPGDQITDLSVAGTLAIGMVMVAVMAIVTLLYVVIFLARIIFLWILIILSPLAYLFATFPGTRQYWNQWWQKFWQYAAIGPILAFFLWLTLTVTAAGNASLLLNAKNLNANTALSSSGAATAAISAVGSQAGILSFLVAILLLIFSLKTASDFSVAGGSWASKTFQSAQRGFTGAISRGVSSPFLAAGNNIATPLALGAAGGITGALARSRIPLASGWAAKQNARVSKARKSWEDKQTKWMEDVQDPRIMAGFANRSAAVGRLPVEGAQRRKARKLAPSTIGGLGGTANAEMIREIQGMEMDDFKKLSPREQRRISTKLQGAGTNLAEVAKEKAAWLIKDASAEKRRASGFHAAGWTVDSATGNVLFNNRPPRGVPVTSDPTVVRDFATRLLSDVDQAKFNVTREAIRQRHGNNAEEFFRSQEYGLNKDKFLGREDFLETFELQQERQRKQERGETRLAELTGARTAIQKGLKGEKVNLAMDFAEGAAIGLALGNAAGANLTGEQKQKAAAALAEKYKEQEEGKEIDRRRQELQAVADQEYETQRIAAAQRGEIGSAVRRTVTGEEATASVKADAAFQQKLLQNTTQFQSALANAESLNLINKGRTGRTARQVLRHEESHDKIDTLKPAEINEMWSQLAPERQQEIEAYVRQNWAGGKDMPLEQVQKEFFTEAYASYGRGKQLGPLSLAPDAEQWEETRKNIEENFKKDPAAFYNSDTYKLNPGKFLTLGNYERRANQISAEQGVMGQLDATLAKNQLDRSQAEVDRLPDDGLRDLYKTLPQERKRAIAEYIRSTREEGKAYSDDDVMRDFFSQALAAHRGGSADGPLAFTKDEQEMALLLHASARGKVPQFIPRATRPAASAPVSVAEVNTRPAKPATVAAPAGSSRVSATPPMRIVERSFEAPISPTVQTNVIQNTTVQSVASDFGQKLEGKLGGLPSRQDLLYFLQNLQANIAQVAKQQGITDAEIHGLDTEIEQLKADVRSPSQLPKDQEALRSNIRAFMKRFGKPGGERLAGGEETPAAAA